MTDRCVCCGAVIPEGRQICQACESKEHADVCEEIHVLWLKKNADYGNSFTELFREYGLTSAAIRLSDKFNRFKSLIKKDPSEQQVKDESIRDTLIDLAGYSIMTVMEMDKAIYLEKEASK